MNVESVAWLSAMKAVDYTLFYLLATWTFILFIEKGKIKHYLFTVLLFVLGCYSLTEYISKFFLPYNLLYIYPFPMRVGEAMPVWLLVYPALLLTVIAALWKYLSKGALAAALMFFLANQLRITNYETAFGVSQLRIKLKRNQTACRVLKPLQGL
jgi:hypothetical protein